MGRGHLSWPAATGISKIVDNVLANHLANPVVRTRFEHARDFEDLRKKAIEFFAAGSGGSEAYTGKDMRTAHAGMNISEQEYMAVMDDIMAALVSNGVDEPTQKDVLAIIYSLKGDIIKQ